MPVEYNLIFEGLIFNYYKLLIRDIWILGEDDLRPIRFGNKVEEILIHYELEGLKEVNQNKRK